MRTNNSLKDKYHTLFTSDFLKTFRLALQGMEALPERKKVIGNNLKSKCV